MTFDSKDSRVTSIDVGKYFIDHIIQNEGKPSVMQILKLTYLAQGFHLALEGEVFFEEKVYAWSHGPVIKELYKDLKKLCKENSHFIEKQSSDDLDISCFTFKQVNILRVVSKKYSALSGWDLSTMTHIKGTPWAKTYKENSKYKVIDEDLIKEYFKQIITPSTFVILLSQN